MTMTSSPASYARHALRAEVVAQISPSRSIG
jgi:hypothetical protein